MDEAVEGRAPGRWQDPHGVRVSGDRGFVRWQSAPDPQMARQIYADIAEWLVACPERVGGLSREVFGTEVVLRRVEAHRIVAEERIRVALPRQ